MADDTYVLTNVDSGDKGVIEITDGKMEVITIEHADNGGK